MRIGVKWPPVSVPVSAREISLDIVSIIGILFGAVVVRVYWTSLPGVIPTHFGFSGKPDAWGPKATLLMLPAASIVIYALLTIVSRYPQLYNPPVKITEENAARQFAIGREMFYWLKAEMIWLMTYVEWQTIQTALGRASGLGALLSPVIIIVLLLTIAVCLAQAYRAR